MRSTLLTGTPPRTDAAVVWTTRWETSLAAEDHDAVAALLARSYAASATEFPPGRSWAGARPELRVLGRRGGGVVAHAAVVRRFLHAPEHDASVLVGDVGLIAVHPGTQGTGLGAALMDTVATTLARLDVSFGFLTCGHRVRRFYERCGWTALSAPISSIRIDGAPEDHRRNGMMLPVHRPVGDWPSGRIERNGQEI